MYLSLPNEKWVKSELDNPNSLIIFFFEIQYEIPPELTLLGKTKKDRFVVAFKWD